ncbi:MAG: PstS family phosphate ABC transporter substrate-binding protein [Thermodesulfobacteriota bacterium]
MLARWIGCAFCFWVLVAVQALPSQADEPKQITVRVGGSHSLVESAEVWGKDYTKEHPNIAIVATSGGTAVGMRKLFEGEVDMVFASEQITDEEKMAASKQGVTPAEHFVGMGGICVVCNKANPVESVTKEQVKKLFTGEAKSWKEIGGPDVPVKIILRRPGEGRWAGTEVSFEQRMLEGGKYSTDTVNVSSFHRLLKHVTTEKGGIGVVGCLVLTVMDHPVKVLALKTKEDSPPVKWSKKTFQDQTYPLSRPLYFYWNEKSPNTAHFKAFAEYCTTRIWEGK